MKAVDLRLNGTGIKKYLWFAGTDIFSQYPEMRPQDTIYNDVFIRIRDAAWANVQMIIRNEVRRLAS